MLDPLALKDLQDPLEKEVNLAPREYKERREPLALRDKPAPLDQVDQLDSKEIQGNKE